MNHRQYTLLCRNLSEAIRSNSEHCGTLAEIPRKVVEFYDADPVRSSRGPEQKVRELSKELEQTLQRAADLTNQVADSLDRIASS